MVSPVTLNYVQIDFTMLSSVHYFGLLTKIGEDKIIMPNAHDVFI